MQVTSLLEALPGIASVLRNPVADAFVGLIRAGARLGEFKLADAEEILRYAVRRTLMTQDETDRILAEVKAASEKRAERAAERERGRAAGKKPVAKAPKAAKVKPKAKPKVAKAPAKKAARVKKK
ncbi:MAG: hypothetical protein AB7L66_20025 [Gemmatimonadales bacterium]